MVDESGTKTFLDAKAREMAETVEAPARIAEPALPPLSAERYSTPNPYRRGGLGQVWKVRDKLIGRDVALKTLRPDRMDNPINHARFSREARITGQLEHPSVVPLYDLLYLGDKLCYTMRFLDGRTMAEAIEAYHKKRQQSQDSSLDLTSILDSFVQVCRSVAYAHSRDICHRDLKGQNVILGDYGEVFVVDWGLGKKVDEPDIINGAETKEFGQGNPDELTASGVIVGTPGYMAPEVAGGSTASKHSDVYGLGAILHTILTGETPFKGSSPRDIMARCQREDPIRPRVINPSISPALEAICVKAMARNPKDRYADATALAEDVRRWLADEPVAAFEDPLSVKALRFAKRHRTPVTAAVVLLAASVVALSAGSYLVWLEKKRTDEAILKAMQNLESAYKAALGAYETIISNEAFVSSNQEKISKKKDALIAGSKAFREYLQLHPGNEELLVQTASILRLNANVHRFDGELSKADGLYSESLSLAEKMSDYPASLEMQSQILRDWAQLKVLQGKLKEALDIDDKCKSISDKLFANKQSEPGYQRLVATNELDRSAILSAMGKSDEAEDASKRSIEIYKKLTALTFEKGKHPYDQLLYSAALNRLSNIKRCSGNLEEALKINTNAIEQLQIYLGRVKRTTPNKDKPNDIYESFSQQIFDGINHADIYHIASRARLERVQILMRRENPKGMNELFNAIVQQWINLTLKYPNTHIYQSSLADALVIRGEWLAKQNQAKEAKTDFEQARKIADELIKRSTDLPSHYATLGQAWFGLAKLDKSADALLKAESAMKKAVEMSPEMVEDKKKLEEIQSTKF
ncbi:MAG: protein kinase [Gemmataceae bacterium]